MSLALMSLSRRSQSCCKFTVKGVSIFDMTDSCVAWLICVRSADAYVPRAVGRFGGAGAVCVCVCVWEEIESMRASERDSKRAREKERERGGEREYVEA